MATTFFQPPSVGAGDTSDARVALEGAVKKAAHTLETLARGQGTNPAVDACSKATSAALARIENVINNQEDNQQNTEKAPQLKM